MYAQSGYRSWGSIIIALAMTWRTGRLSRVGGLRRGPRVRRSIVGSSGHEPRIARRRLPFASMNGAARTRLVGGGILVATGLVWIGQGTALIKSSSFMTGDPFWAWTGLAAVVVGIGLIAWAMRATRPG